MKNLLFHLKAVKTGTHKAQVGAGAGSGAEAGAETLIVGAGAGGKSNSFGSTTLQKNSCYCTFKERNMTIFRSNISTS
jgi:hypothetical protein